MEADLEEVVEGRTTLIVPRGSVAGGVPPREPAFFNPRARLNRDLSLVAYGTFAAGLAGPKTLLEGMSGTGARGLRVANELDVDCVAANDLNPSAVRMARDSARLNGTDNVSFSGDEACRFFSRFSERGKRGSMVDIDPFGSPAPFFDCGLRATMHGGILSCTATDLQVLNGMFQGACRRRYGGVPVRVTYGNEVAIRLVLGCLRSVAARLGMGIDPLFVESDQHYYRTYVRVDKRPDQRENMGFVLHCRACMRRKTSPRREPECEECGSANAAAGPLWTGRLFDGGFVRGMALAAPGMAVDKACGKILAKAALEADMPGTYYTLDEIAAGMKASPPKLDSLIGGLRDGGFASSPTSLGPTGFRTDAAVGEIRGLFAG